MPKQFDGQLCVLCNLRPSSPTGEHVWPDWFLDLFPESDGPYSRLISGQPEVKRDGSTVRTQTSAERVKLPCCIECNGTMNRRFEQSAKAIVREVIEVDGYLTLPTDEAETLGRWLVKTWLLLAHPAARSSMPEPSPQRWNLHEVPDDLYTWLISDEPPPLGLSLWIAREDPDFPQPIESRGLPLPVVKVGNRTTAFQAFRCSIRFLDITLAYHPGWEIAHPLESERRALRLWPPVPTAMDLGSLPPVAVRDTVWVEGPTLEFAPGSYGEITLPPISAGGDLLFTGLPGLIFAAAPRLAAP